MLDRSTAAFLGVIAVILLAFLLVQSGFFVSAGEYDRATVTVHEGDGGEQLANVDVRIADTQDKRYLGLSNTSSLARDEGMLFVHDEEGSHGYVMRRMDFPLDIIFVDANGTITTIHHAPTRENGARSMEPFQGHGKYVLEVNRGWANRTGVTVGDTVAVPAEYAPANSTAD